MSPTASPGDPRTDEALVAAANSGDPAAFDALYLRYRDWVFRLAWRMTGDQDVAGDVLQDTFLYFLRRFPGFRLRARLTTFLYPVVKNTVLLRLRREERCLYDESLLHALAARAPASPDRARADLTEALACLDADALETLLLRFVDGLSMDEIAEALAVPAGTVKSRLHNALAKLREDKNTRQYFGV
jgi:RNA polymerase sigma-70 factor, ECF subfamily